MEVWYAVPLLDGTTAIVNTKLVSSVISYGKSQNQSVITLTTGEKFHVDGTLAQVWKSLEGIVERKTMSYDWGSRHPKVE